MNESQESNRDDQELGFNAWILVGNVLHNALHGPEQLRIVDAALRARLLALDEALRAVTPEGMTSALRSLSRDERLLLAGLTETSFDRAGEDGAALLGMPREDAASVIDMLRQP